MLKFLPRKNIHARILVFIFITLIDFDCFQHPIVLYPILLELAYSTRWVITIEKLHL